MNSEIRKMKVSDSKSNLVAQLSAFARPDEQSKNATTASFKIFHLLAKRRPF
jgi:hypothetical protein